MTDWASFAAQEPELARNGRRLLMLNLEGDAATAGLAYLATVRRDGGPRIHPISPVLHAGRLYTFVLHVSPKQADLRRRGHYALHSYPYPLSQEFGPDEFLVAGRATLVDDPAIHDTVASACGDPPESGLVFELGIERVMYRDRWHPDERPVYRVWQVTAGCGMRDA
jgi:hypothetical protein